MQTLKLVLSFTFKFIILLPVLYFYMHQAEAEVAKENVKPSVAGKGNARHTSSAIGQQLVHNIDFKLTGQCELVVN